MLKKVIYSLAFFFSSIALCAQTYRDLYGTSLKIKQDPDSANEITIVAPVLTSDLTFTLPSTMGTNGQVLTSDGTGGLSWTTVSGGGVAGNNTEVQLNNSGSMGADSDLIFIDSTNYLGINNTSPTAHISVGGNLKLGDGTNTAGIVLYSELGATDYTFTLSAPPSLSTSRTFTWPDDYGSNGQLLTTNGSFGLEWSSTAVSTGSDCIGIGNDGNDTGNNTVSGALGFVGGGTDNTVGANGQNSFIGSGEDNTVNAVSSAIGGGEQNDISSGGYSLIGAGRFNEIQDSYSAIMAGENNTIHTGASYSFIGAGNGNDIRSTYSVIGAGANNEIDTASSRSFIGAGSQNHIENSISSAIIAGTSNTITNGQYSIIGAGTDNTINAEFSFIAAGDDNNIAGGYGGFIGAGSDNYSSGTYTSIPGGINDTINGDYALIIGSYCDISADYATAIGKNATVNHDGSFVLGGDDVTVSSSTTNQLTALFSGGIYFYTNSGTSIGARVTSGANSWSSVSDRNAKENIDFLSNKSAAEGLANLNISSWSYKSTPDFRIRNYGPMAQDFFRIFGKDEKGYFGTDTTIVPLHLTSIGISAVQHNAEIIGKMKLRLKEVRKKNDALEEELFELERMMDELDHAGEQ